MRRGLTGYYEVSQFGGETVRAFVPHPLPPEPPLQLETLERQLERASLALGRLDSVTLLLPEPTVFLYAYVRREAVLSSQIEGTQSSLADLLLFESEQAPGAPLDDVVEVSRYVAALEHGMRRLREGIPLSNRLLREMHGVLLSGGRGAEKQPGEFRRTQNWIGGTRPGNAHFVPPPPHCVAECMAALERFLYEETLPTLIKAGLAHAQFETIHPFLDGNGRLGRLLISFMLHHEGVLQRPLLYLSLFLKQHRREYYRLLDATRFEGDWESWLQFFLEGVESTAQNAVETARNLVDLFQQDTARVVSLGRLASSAQRVLNAFKERPLMTARRVRERTGLSMPVVNECLNRLCAQGILAETTGKQRNRVFAYAEYLRLLSEGTEPLPRDS
ncbi:MAG: Fic family protein [Fimbriimonadales bacterium]|nr:Fic family protein [Fimbriimonadales bacterium]